MNVSLRRSRNISPISHDLSCFSIIPKCVRLAVFKFAILPFANFFERFFVNRCHNYLAGNGYFSCMADFDIKRAQNTVEALIHLGGEKISLIPQDEEAKLQVIRLKFSNIKAKIERLGGSWQKYDDKIIIQGPDLPSTDWILFYNQTLKKIFPKETILNGKRTLITSEFARNLPFGSSNGRTKCVFVAGFAKSFVMSKAEIAYFLGKGIDVCVYDSRGILNSEGYPSEGGFYNDIEAVGDLLFNTFKYDPHHTCVYASCGASFTAVHLFKKFSGLNLLLKNAPGSLQRVISKINCIARWLFNFGKRFIKAPSLSVCSRQMEDEFDSFNKIRNISCVNGTIVLIGTLGDQISPLSEINEIADMLRSRIFENGTVTVLNNNALDSNPEIGIRDPHLSDPLKNPHLQENINRCLFI